jgi:cytidylate kinase
MKTHIIIAVDGPAGSGKSTIAKRIALDLNLLYIDTGAMYRAITHAVLSRGVNAKDEEAVNALLAGLDLNIAKNDQGAIEISLEGRKLEKELRNIDVDRYVSLISSYRKVREYMVARQRQLSRDYDVILDGRDIGTVVFPGATCKFYLDASVEERARRRFHDSKAQKGLSMEEIRKEIERRDDFDRNREISPLRKAEDAVLVDTSRMTIDQVTQLLLARIREFT